MRKILFHRILTNWPALIVSRKTTTYFYTPSPSLPLNVLVFFPRYLFFVFLFVEYHAMHDGLGSETTEEVEPQKQRVIYVNAPQPVKYCYNKIRYSTLYIYTNLVDSCIYKSTVNQNQRLHTKSGALCNRDIPNQVQSIIVNCQL